MAELNKDCQEKYHSSNKSREIIALKIIERNIIQFSVETDGKGVKGTCKHSVEPKTGICLLSLIYTRVSLKITCSVAIRKRSGKVAVCYYENQEPFKDRSLKILHPKVRNDEFGTAQKVILQLDTRYRTSH